MTSEAPVILSLSGVGTVIEGGTVTFTASVSGTEPIAYQWNRDGVAIPNANSSTFTLANIQSWDSGAYTLVVSNAHGTDTSFPLTVVNTSVLTLLEAPVDTTVSLGVAQLIGGGSFMETVDMVKFAAFAEDIQVSTMINALVSQLTMINSESFPFQIAMSLFPNTWRSTIGGKEILVSFSVKFIDETNPTEFVEVTEEHQYTLEIPGMANREFLSVYRENIDGSVTYVTNATLVPGETYLYTFSIDSNSVYSIIDPGALIIGPGIGSDPHVTTLDGRHRIMKKIRGRDRDVTILSDQQTSIRGRIQGYRLGDYLSQVQIMRDKRMVCEIDFHKNEIRVLDGGFVKEIRQVNSSGLKNSVNSNKLRQLLFLDALNPGGVYLYVDFNQRYLCPVFNQVIQNTNLRGELV